MKKDLEIMMDDVTMETSICASCGHPWNGITCMMCGYMARSVTVQSPFDDKIGEQVSIGDVQFEAVSIAPAGLSCTSVSGKSATQDTVTAFVYDDADHAVAIRKSYKILGEHALKIVAQGHLDGRPADLARLTGLSTLAGALARAVIERTTNHALDLIEKWFLPLIRMMADVEKKGHFFGGLDPADIYYDAEGTCYVRCASTLLALSDGPHLPDLRRLSPGFAAPELYGRYGGIVGSQVDVYFLGAVLYGLIARVAPLADCGKEGERYPAVRVYHEDVPHLLGAVALRSVSPLISRRYQTIAEMLEAVETALTSDRVRENAANARIELKLAHEIHIGLLKGIYSPVNQDDLFVGYNMASGKGLFLVTDGVSISRYGTGDQASGCVRQAAAQYWRSQQTTASFTDDDPTLSIAKSSTSPGKRGDDLDYRRQCNFLDSILADANQKIGVLVEPELPASVSSEPHAVEGIMAATTVAMSVEDNRAAFMFIGDSRIYLLRGGLIAQISIDHNLKTQLIRNGHSPLLAQTVNGANALVRCVGQFERDDTGTLVSCPLDPEFAQMTLLPGDRLVLCSDGITDYAGIDEEHSEELICSIVHEAPDPRWAAFELMVAANRGGGGDNISCIVLEVLSPTKG